MGRSAAGCRRPSSAIIGGVEGDEAFAAYRDVVRLSRLGWSALAIGTAKAMLDYVIPYVNGARRSASRSPTARRSPSWSPPWPPRSTACAWSPLRGASRAEQGLSFARETALARKLTIDKGLQIGLDGAAARRPRLHQGAPVERWYRDLRGAGIGEGIVVL